ncbi:hypothetical protein JL722_9410 [Aureococcus anophagefferens]|nr:hypothetical protein JL722_9410 [Aureococcus anophagefferens]
MRFAPSDPVKMPKRHGDKFKRHKPPHAAPAQPKPPAKVALPGEGAPGPKERAYQLKVDAARAVGYRETLLMQLNAVVLHWPRKSTQAAASDMGARALAEAARLLRNIAAELRHAGLRCVEKIVAWVLHESADAAAPAAFLWNGKDYLRKMADDLDFVSDALGAEAWRAACFCPGNPLLLTRDEINGVGAPGRVGRLQAASVVILDVVRRHRASAAERHRAARAVANSRAAEKLEHAGGVYRRAPPKAKRGSRGSEGSRAATPDRGGAAEPEARGREPASAAGARRARRQGPGHRLRRRGNRRRREPDARAARPARGATPPARGAASARRQRPAPPKTPPKTPKAKSPRPGGAAARFAVGDRVDADFNEEGEYYPGTVARVNADGTYYITYDDGDEEDKVREAMVEPAAAEPATSPGDAPPAVAVDDDSIVDEEEAVPETRSPASAAASPRAFADEPAAGEPSASASALDDAPEPAAALDEPVADEPAVEEEPVADEPAVEDEPVADEPAVEEEPVDEPAVEEEPVVDEPAVEEEPVAVSAEPAVLDEPVVVAADPPVLAEPAAARPQTPEAAADEPLDEPVAEEPSDDAAGGVEEECAVVEEAGDDYEDDAEEYSMDEDAFAEDSAEAAESPVRETIETNPHRGAASCYEFGALLGEGAYGEVYRGRHRASGASVAVKKLKIVADGADEDAEMARYAVLTAERELALLRAMGDHANVVRFTDSWQEDLVAGSIAVVAPVLCFELLAMTALHALEDRGPGAFGRGLCLALTRDLCAALAHIHALRIVHRDIKPENVLLSGAPGGQRCELKLCDFGAARQLEGDLGPDGVGLAPQAAAGELTHYIGSRWYRAPEMMASSTTYGLRVDVWGAACITAELATGEPLFPGDEEHGVLRQIASLLGPLPPAPAKHLARLGVPKRCLDAGPAVGLRAAQRGALLAKLGDAGLDLLGAMLRPDAAARLSASACLDHAALGGRGRRRRRGRRGRRRRAARAAAARRAVAAGLPPRGGARRGRREPRVLGRGPGPAPRGLGARAALRRARAATPWRTRRPRRRGARAARDAAALFPRAADALVAVGADDVDAWLDALVGDDGAPRGALRAALRAALDPQQQRGELTLTQAVDAVEAQVGAVDVAASSRAAVAARLLQRAYPLVVAPDRGGDRATFLGDLAEPDAVFERAASAPPADDGAADDGGDGAAGDLGAGSDVGSAGAAPSGEDGAQRSEASLLDALRGAVEERFHARSVNEALAVVTPMLVDSEVASAAKTRGVSRLEGPLGLPPLRDHAALLRPASKAALLYVALARRPARRLNLVTARGSVWGDCEHLIARHTACLDAAAAKAVVERLDGGDGDDLGDLDLDDCDYDEDVEGSGEEVEARGERPVGEDGEPGSALAIEVARHASFIVCPYYRAPFGQKYVEGVAVEEGEGLGPRKELFSLLGATARRDWTPAGGFEHGLRVAPRRAGDGPNVLRLVVDDDASRGAAESGAAGQPWPGHVLAVDYHDGDGAARTLDLVVERLLDGDGAEIVARVSTSSTALRAAAAAAGGSGDDALGAFFASLERCHVEPRARCQAMLVHRGDLEALWLNPALPRTAANARKLAMLGLLVGSAVPNQCQLPLELPPLFFEVLGVAEDRADVSPRRAPGLVDAFLAKAPGHLELLDGGYAETVAASLKLDDASLDAMAALEGWSTADLVGAAGGAPGEAGHRARVGYAPVRRGPVPRARRIVCGAPEFRGDFKFRDVFRIVMDAELRDCRPLHDALWAVIDGEDDSLGDGDILDEAEPMPGARHCEPLDAAQRRKLLKFVTGVERLPARHTEFLTIELPFLPFGVDEQRRMLAMIPQSHTCDNILELPNYWEALLKTRVVDGGAAPPRGSPESNALERELRHVVRTKLLVAIDNATGYGLDALEPHVSHALACAAEDDAAAAALLAHGVLLDARDAAHGADGDYACDYLFDDDDDGDIPAIPSLGDGDGGGLDESIPALDDAIPALDDDIPALDDEAPPDIPALDDDDDAIPALDDARAAPDDDLEPLESSPRPDADAVRAPATPTQDDSLDISGLDLGEPSPKLPSPSPTTRRSRGSPRKSEAESEGYGDEDFEDFEDDIELP